MSGATGPASKPATVAEALASVLYAALGAIAVGSTRLVRLTAREPLRRRWLGERLGDWRDEPGRPDEVCGPTVWFHAASIGEVGIANRLAQALLERAPGLRLLLTCNTLAGRAGACEAFCEVRSLPLDRAWIVRKVLDRVAPALYVFVETEIWPVLLLELANRKVPAVMVNARISDRSLRVYRMGLGLGPGLIRPALASLTALCAREERSRRRLLALGARPEATHLCGDIKLDASTLSASRTRPKRQAAARGPVLIAASVRRAEIDAVADAYRLVRSEHADVCMVLAPRYPRDADAAVSAVARDGVRAVRRSELGASQLVDVAGARGDWDILVLDTLGELAGLYPGALGAFVGGTLDGTGGHSIAEPAACGLPIVVGPALANVREHARALESRGALVRVEDARALSVVWSRWLADPERARADGAAARAYVEESRGALERTLSVLTPLLDGVSA